MKSRCTRVLLSLIVPAVVVVSCSPQPPPTLEEIKNSTFLGLDRGTMEVTLTNGSWTGKPSRRDTTLRQQVRLIADFLVTGDLDSNGSAEAVVLLNETFGGAEIYTYMAALAREGGKLVNRGTELLGDRIQVRKISVRDGILIVDLIETAPFDPLGSPGELVTKEWKLLPNRFALHTLRSPGRFSLDLIANETWTLRMWNPDEPVRPGTQITLSYAGGQLTGTGGCYRYFAPVTEGPFAGDLTVGVPGSTRMACADSVMAIESRFLSDLQTASKFGFYNGRMAITVGADSSRKLLFEKADSIRVVAEK